MDPEIKARCTAILILRGHTMSTLHCVKEGWLTQDQMYHWVCTWYPGWDITGYAYLEVAKEEYLRNVGLNDLYV